MFKFLFVLLTDPLGLPIEWYYEYLILAAIGAVAYGIAYRCVGDLYHSGAISGRTSGSFFHWLIRLILFAALWAVTYGVIVAVRWLTENWIMVLCIFGGIVSVAGITVAVFRFIRNRKKKPETEVAADA